MFDKDCYKYKIFMFFFHIPVHSKWNFLLLHWLSWVFSLLYVLQNVSIFLLWCLRKIQTDAMSKSSLNFQRLLSQMKKDVTELVGCVFTQLIAPIKSKKSTWDCVLYNEQKEQNVAMEVSSCSYSRNINLINPH